KAIAVLEHLEDQIVTQQTQGSESTMALIARGEGKRRMDAVRSVHEEVRDLEHDKLDLLEAHERKILLYTNTALIALTIFDLILFILAFTLLFKALRGARDTEKQLNLLHAETVKRGEVLALKNKYKNIQARLNDVLQSVISPEEAYAAIEKHCTHLFPGYPGALYIRSNSKDYFELKAKWNGGHHSEGFEPDECWAARNNQSYEYNGEHDDLPCRHVKADDEDTMYAICLPISSRDEMIGILSMVGPKDEAYGQSPIDPEVVKLAHEVVGQIGLSIANLRLRESLRKSSIIDALTGLYNRRYLDETLLREIARAERAKYPIGIIMLDIDHFKMFNDNYGHDAGDIALREIGLLLKNVCRTSDIPCRYGGEEFMIILPQADMEAAAARAEVIRWEVKKLHLTYGSESLPAITVSLGVAVFPQHGTRYEDVIKAADASLYLAKRKGRDRVEMPPDPSE
ncbi:MAG TPA: diguanylate cyclase, partial [Methylophilaceae bacterium]|nr:diguanylate cyclase [Methylophilaceae bacterium]